MKMVLQIPRFLFYSRLSSSSKNPSPSISLTSLSNSDESSVDGASTSFEVGMLVRLLIFYRLFDFRYVSKALSMISSLSFLFQNELFPQMIKLLLRVLCDIERRLSESMLLTMLKVLLTFELEPEIDYMRLPILHKSGNLWRRYVRTDFHKCFALGDLGK